VAKLRIEPAGVEVDVPPGEGLIDVCDEHPEVRVSMSCRDASCGTCCVTVVEGAGALDPPGEDERRLLATLRAPPSTRLCCKLRVGASAARIVLRTDRRP